MSHQFSQLLLEWYEQYGRKGLPWQENPTPYRVWLSEIMLQQTQVKTVIPYFLKFTEHFPQLTDLAQAPLDEILHLWAGLGYYARARNLYKTANIIAEQYQGEFPNNIDKMTQLPGIGRSTAGAIMSFGMGANTPILDGNCKRVYSRFAVIDGITSSSNVQKRLWDTAIQHTPDTETDKYNQAIMDLGATICLRSKPNCNICPVEKLCLAKQNNTVHLYPEKKRTKKTPQKIAFFLILRNSRGEIFLQKRPPSGIWGGLWCFPQYENRYDLLDWLDNNTLRYEVLKEWPKQEHTFTHFKLLYTPVEVKISQIRPAIKDDTENLWFKKNRTLQLGMATPIKNILKQIKF